MSIQYKVPGFELTTFGTWVSSHNHALKAIFFVFQNKPFPTFTFCRVSDVHVVFLKYSGHEQDQRDEARPGTGPPAIGLKRQKSVKENSQAKITHLLCKGKNHWTADLLFDWIGFKQLNMLLISL